MSMPSTIAQRIFRMQQLEEIVGIRRSSIYAAIRDGHFPAPVPLTHQRSGHGAVGWFESEVNAWVAERTAQRDSERGHRAAGVIYTAGWSGFKNQRATSARGNASEIFSLHESNTSR